MELKLTPLAKDAPEFVDKVALSRIMTSVGFPMSSRTVESWPEIAPSHWAGVRAVYRLREVYAAASKRLSAENPKREALERARAARRMTRAA